MKSFAQPLHLGCQPEKGANTDTEIPRNAQDGNPFFEHSELPTAGTEGQRRCTTANRAVHVQPPGGRRFFFRSELTNAARAQEHYPQFVICLTQHPLGLPRMGMEHHD
jgi:hypothetical protein